MQKESESESRRPFYKRLTFKFYTIAVIAAVVLLVFSLFLLRDSMNYVVSNLMHRQLTVDLNFLFDEFEEHSEMTADWNRRDGALYIGDLLLGDGTLEHADTVTFSHCERLTGSYYYSFVRTENDADLPPGEGHYLRVAGSTRGSLGERIEGTYLDKEVADLLEASENDECFLVADVEGRRIRTLYRLIRDRSGEIIGAMAAGRSEEELHRYIMQQERTAFFLIITVMLAIFAMLGVFLRILIRKLSAVKAHLDRIGSGDLPEEKLLLHGDDELSDVAETVNEMTASLREKKRMGAELLVAADIQTKLLPREADSSFPEEVVEIAATMQPAREIAGDFYDYFMAGDRHLFFIVADVSGKGLPAALFMVRAKTLVKSYAQMGLSPAKIMEYTNRALCEGNDEEFFVTAWLGMLDLVTGELTYVNAGHNMPMIRTGNGSFAPLSCCTNFVLAGFERVIFKEEHRFMAPGDRILLYTDGVTEALNKDEVFFGMEGLAGSLSRTADASSGEILRALKEDLRAFLRDTEPNDDVTVLCLHYLKIMEHGPGQEEKEFDALSENLPEFLSYVEERLTETALSEKEMLGFLGTAEEVFLNVAHYAYGGAGGILGLRILPEDGKAVRLTFTDYGIPFNPLKRPDPDTTSEVADRKIGGLGIYMMKNFADDLSYRYEDGKNILTVTKVPKDRKGEENDG